MPVIGAVDDQWMLQSPGLSGQVEKRNKVEREKAPATKAKSSTDKPAKSWTDSKPAKASTDVRIEELDQKWSERINWLEALLLARTLDRSQESTFQTVKVVHTHSSPASMVRTTNSSSQPTGLLLSLDHLPWICLKLTVLPCNSLPANLTSEIGPTNDFRVN